MGTQSKIAATSPVTSAMPSSGKTILFAMITEIGLYLGHAIMVRTGWLTVVLEFC